jgi:hypothetical protein
MKACRFASIVVVAATLVCGRALAAGVVISQVYGGGGNMSAPYTNDFIELFNNDTIAISVTGWSVQYASTTGSSWSVTNLSGVLQPGHYFLIQEAAGAGNGVMLPSPDNTGVIPLANNAGKVALVSNTTALTGVCPSAPQIVDLVGYGATTNCYEGSAPAATLSNTTAALRTDPCYDTDDNAADVSAAAPNPRNFATTPVSCPTPPPVDYAVLQFPSTATGTACEPVASATIIYGRIYVQGVTGQNSAQPGIVADVGVGPSGSDPALTAGWKWARATFNLSSANDDEYQEPIPGVHASGMYDYAYRFSYLGGPFVYADLDGSTTNGYTSGEAGKLTVSGDDIYCDRFDP